MSLEGAQEQLEAQFGCPGRSPKQIPREIFSQPVPMSMEGSDLLFPRGDHILGNLVHSRVVIGRLAMANSALFKVGRVALPAEFVFSWDRWFVRRPHRLGTICDALVGHYDAADAPRSPSKRYFAESITSGLRRSLGQQVPPLMTQGRLVYHATVLVYPGFIPNGLLRGGDLVALFANVGPGHRRSFLIPHQYWPADLLATWSE